MNRYNRIKQKLGVLNPHYLEIIDETKLHSGHRGIADPLESHFRIKINSKELAGKNLVTAHKMINNLLKNEFENGLHALSIDIIKA